MQRRIRPTVAMAAAFVAVAGIAMGSRAWAQPLEPALATELARFQASHRVSQRIVSADGRRLRLIRGQLTSASDASVDRVVREFLDEHGTLVGVRESADVQVRRVLRL